MSSRSSDSSNMKTNNELTVAIYASGISGFLLVGGFCWLMYYICQPNKRNVPRGHPKVRSHSISSGASVPGDSHGHYYAPNGPRNSTSLYVEQEAPAYAQTTRSLSPNLLSIYDLPTKPHPAGIANEAYDHHIHDGDPPPYPGYLNAVVSHPHSPSQTPLPPPYSA